MNLEVQFRLDKEYKVIDTSLLPIAFKEKFGLDAGASPSADFLELLKGSKFESTPYSDVHLDGWNFKFATVRQNGYLRIKVDLSSNKKNITPVNRYQLLVEAANDIIFEIDVNGYFTYLNPAALDISGYEEKDILGQNFLKVVREDWRARTVDFYRKQMQESVKSTYYEFPGINAQQDVIWIGQKVQLLEDESGIIGLMAVGRDITEHRIADEALKRSEEKYRGIIQKLQAGLLEVDLEEKIHYVNEAMTKITGYSQEELMGSCAGDLLTDKSSRERVDEEHKKRDKGEGSVYEVKLNHKNGEPLWALISGAPLYNENGERTGSIGIHLDITERKKAEKELEYTQNRLSKYKRALELINEVTANTELSYEQQLKACLDAAADYLDVPMGLISEIEGDEYTVREYYLAEDQGYIQKGLKWDFKKTYCEIVFEQEQLIAIDHFSQSEFAGHPCYEYFRFETYIGVPYFVKGLKRGTVNFYAPEPRETSFDSYDKEFLNLLAKWMGALFSQMDSQAALEEEQKALEERNEELFQQRNFLNSINKFVTTLLDKDDLEEIAWEIAENVIKNFGFEDCVIYLLDSDKQLLNQVAVYGPKMGGEREILNPIQIPLGEGIVGSVAKTGIAEIIPDTTKDDRYIVDDAVRLSEMTVPLVSDGEVFGVIDSEHEEKDFFTSEHLYTLNTVANLAANRLKIATAKASQKVAEEELRDSESKLRTIIASALDAVVSINGKGVVTEWNKQAEVIFGYTADEAIGKSLTQTIIPTQHRSSHKKGMSHYFKTGEGPVLGQKIEITALKKGGVEFPIELAIVPVVMKGEHSFTAFISDITIQKQVQAETEKALKRERELNELKSKFVSMTSHEFRTPLTTIKQNVDLISYKIEEELPDSFRDYNKFLRRIESEINRVTLLMNDILTLGRIESGGIEIEKKANDLKAFFEAGIQTQTQSRADGRDIKFKVSGVPQPVEIDDHLFDHIMTNLISNAFKYSEGEKDPEIHLDYSQLERVRFTVKDHGIGIPRKDQKGLFQSFYRATNVKNIQGSGLGLSIVKEFVDLHDGTIAVESDTGKGCKFIVEIPYK